MAPLVAGLLALVLAAVGVAYATMRGFRLWRTTKRVGGTMTSALDQVSAATTQIDEQVRLAQASTERLKVAAAGLQRSQAQLRARTDAVAVARDEIKRMFWFVPGV